MQFADGGVVLAAPVGTPVTPDLAGFEPIGTLTRPPVFTLDRGEAIVPSDWTAAMTRFAGVAQTVTARFQALGEDFEALRRIMMWPNPWLDVERSPRSLRRRRAKLRRKRRTRARQRG